MRRYRVPDVLLASGLDNPTETLTCNESTRHPPYGTSELEGGVPVEKHIDIRMENCTGCKLCELACSAVKTGSFAPKEARIRVSLIDIPEIPVPILLDSCDYCFGNPVCVRFCNTGAISWREMEAKPERARMEDARNMAHSWLESVSR